MNTYDCGLHAVSNALALAAQEGLPRLLGSSTALREHLRAALDGGELLPFPSEGATVPLDEGRMATLMA